MDLFRAKRKSAVILGGTGTGRGYISNKSRLGADFIQVKTANGDIFQVGAENGIF